MLTEAAKNPVSYISDCKGLSILRFKMAKLEKDWSCIWTKHRTCSFGQKHFVNYEARWWRGDDLVILRSSSWPWTPDTKVQSCVSPTAKALPCPKLQSSAWMKYCGESFGAFSCVCSCAAGSAENTGNTGEFVQHRFATHVLLKRLHIGLHIDSYIPLVNISKSLRH